MWDLFLSKPGKRCGLHFLLHSDQQMRGITSPTSCPHCCCRQSQRIESLAFTDLSRRSEHCYRQLHWFIATSYDIPLSRRQCRLLIPPLSEDNYDDNNDDDDEYNENIINGLHDYDSDGNCHYNYDNLDNDANDADDANADANDDDEEEEDDDDEENEVDRELNDINNKDKDDSDNKEEEDSDNEDSDDDDEDSDDDEVDDLSHNDTASAPN